MRARSPMRRMPWMSAAWPSLIERSQTASASMATGPANRLLPNVHSETGRRNTTSSDRAEQAENHRRPPQDRGRSGNPRRLSRAGRLGDLAHAAAVDAHAGDAVREIVDRAVQPDQADAGRAQQHRHRLGAHDADGDVHDRRAADDRRRLQDLTVGLSAGGAGAAAATVGSLAGADRRRSGPQRAGGHG